MGRWFRQASLPALVAVLTFPPAVSAHPQPGLDPNPLAWGRIAHPGQRLGVDVLSMTPELRRYFEVDPEIGILVTRVVSESPAERAGIRAGDIILEADGQAIRAPRELVRLVRAHPEGERLEVVVSRKGKEKRFKLTPQGEPSTWEWHPGPWMGGMIHELRHHMRQLERRLKELEKRYEQEDLGDTDQT